MKLSTATLGFLPVYICQVWMFCCGLVSSAHAQVMESWVARYNGPGNFTDGASDVAVDLEGNVYVTGGSYGGSTTSTDYATIKYNLAGVQQWVARYNGPGNGIDNPRALAVDNAGNVYVTGQTTVSTTNLDYATVKYNSSGAQQWVARYDGPVNLAEGATAIAVDAMGNVYVTGWSTRTTSYISDFATIKYNSSGAEQWVARYTVPEGPAVAGSITVDNNGNIYVTGQSWGVTSGLDYTTVKYNISGVQQWVTTYNGTGNGDDYILSHAVDNGGNVYVTGYTDGGVANDFATIKYNSSGVQQWVAIYNGPGNLGDHARSLALDPSGNVYVTGTSYGDAITRSDYASIKYDATGAQQWVARYEGSGNLDDGAFSIAVDNAGNACVTGSSSSGTNNTDWATIQYNTDGVQQWLMLYNGPAGENDQGASVVLDNAGNTYVAGSSTGSGTNSDLTTIKYSQTFALVSPSAGDVWIAGETDTIRWIGGPDAVTIQLSTNYEGGQGTFEEIAVNISASDPMYIWDVPSSILSRKCAISIEDATNPDNFVTSDVFKIKPYQLTRVDANGDYEPYQIAQDAWVFANTEENMWPMDWYSDFDYANGEDPFTQQQYADEFSSWWVNARPNHFPDWPSFVRTFGVDQCYVTLSLGGILKPNALLFWSLQKSATWRGSCAGFAGGSFVAFDRKDDFIDRFDLHQFDDLRNVTLDDVSRRVVNEAWTYQFGSVQRNHALAVRISTANSGLNDVKEMFLNELMDNRRIGIFGIRFEWPPVIAHALNPWKVEKDAVNPAIERIHVYENNYPYSLDIAIEVNTDQNSWSYPYWNLQDESFGLGLSSPSSSYLQDANIPLTPGQSALRGGQMEVFNTSTASIVMVNTSDDSIIVDFQDSLYTNNIPLAVENVLITGYPTTPIGYYLPQDTYSVAMSDFADSSMHFAVWSDSTVLMFGRNDADTTETDLLSIDGGIGAGNPDIVAKEGNYLALVVGASDQKMIDLNGFTMVQADSVHFSTVNGNHGRFMNAGPAKTYSLNLMLATDTDLTRFEHPEVSLDAISTHLVTPDWGDLSQVTILVDLGNNGTIDDTMTVGNTVAVEEQTQTSIPTSFSLHQNYPNPFNPATTVAYGLPSRSEVTLRVYNLLGEELSTLVDEVQEAGHQTVSWNASAYPTGVYFYRIQARSLITGEIFIQSGKMSLMK